MDHIISKLLIYGDLPKDSILAQMADICRQAREHTQGKDQLAARVYHQVKQILVIATDYGFDRNLWQNYLTFLLMTDENPFSLTCEKTGAQEGSVNYFAKQDFKAFRELFHYDFRWLEEELPQLRAVPAQATYLLWLDCGAVTHDSGDLSRFLRREAGLWLSSGAEYRGNGGTFLRMNLACPRSRLEEGLRRLKQGITAYQAARSGR